jgi:orotidine-5'-phosphate decarboxylase
MKRKSFIELVHAKFLQGKKFVTVGLDVEWEKLPKHLTQNKKYGSPKVLFDFCRAIIDNTKDTVAAYKPNYAFFEAYGEEGLSALKSVCDYIRLLEEEVAVIVDAKRADIGNTNNGTVKAMFGYLQADAITVNGYFGKQSLAPFLEMKDKGIFVLARTSNPGADEFQNLELKTGEKLYEKVISNIENEWNAPNACLVIGATAPEELERGRKLAPKRLILIPGVGAQGGDLQKAVTNGLNDEGAGILINSSRGIIYAGGGEDFAEVARQATLKLHEEILQIHGGLVQAA